MNNIKAMLLFLLCMAQPETKMELLILLGFVVCVFLAMAASLKGYAVYRKRGNQWR
ncbi:MAG: hypothetical protein AAF438_19770 [Pseudomonadota bacterium]